MKVCTFTTSLLQSNAYLAYFPSYRAGQEVNPLPEDKVKVVFYQAMPNIWNKKMLEQGYNYLDGSIQHIAEFSETRIENLERFD